METDDLRSPRGLYSLGQVKGVGPRTVLKLALQYATWGELTAASSTDLRSVVRSDEVANRLLTDNRPEVPVPLAAGVRCITFFNDEYPAGLRDLADPPALIWVRGEVPAPSAVAIVGTRHPTDWGREVTRRLAQGAVEAGWDVISGLALGVDQIAHEVTLGAGGRTHAVLAGGVDRPSPRSNAGLADLIVTAGGSLISEQPPGVEPQKHHFVERDRLQAALALAVIVTECSQESGALHAALQAVLLRRTLAVPRPSRDSQDGTQALLATPLNPSLLRGRMNKSERLQMERRQRFADIALNADLALGEQLTLSGAVSGEARRVRPLFGRPG